MHLVLHVQRLDLRSCRQRVGDGPVLESEGGGGGGLEGAMILGWLRVAEIRSPKPRHLRQSAGTVSVLLGLQQEYQQTSVHSLSPSQRLTTISALKGIFLLATEVLST